MAATKTLEIGFDSGYQQKTDVLHLEPGAAAVATNLAKVKNGSMAKRVGFTALSNVGIIPSAGQFPSTPTAIVTGRRLASFKNQLVVIGADNQTDAAWLYDDTSGKSVLIDRVPEVYADPWELVAGVSPPAASVLIRANNLDHAIINGYELSVWTVPADAFAAVIGIYYCIRNAATKEVVEPAQLLLSFEPGSGAPVDTPHLVVCGNLAVLVYASGTPNFNIWASTKDFTAIGNPWLAPVRINLVAADANLTVGSQPTTNFDVVTSIGETTKFALAYAQNTGGVKTLKIVRVDVTGGVVSIASSASATDAVWVADGSPPLSAVAVRADVSNNELALAIAYTAVATGRVTVGLYSWPGLAPAATAVDLLTVLGPLSATTLTFAIAIDRIGTVGGLVAYKAMFSNVGLWENGSITNPYVASYIIQNNAGAVAVAANMPRVTWGLSLWSRIIQVNGIGYVVCRVPSGEQGSFFLMADDAWQDITGLNGIPGGELSNSPLRLVGNLSARGSNLFASTIEGKAALFNRVVPNFPLNPLAQGGFVYQALLPRDVGPTSCAPSMTTCDFASVKNYQSAMLGENLIIAAASPSCFDGAQVFELGYPVFPVLSIVAAGAGGTFVAGSYAYIAVYQWTDARGQVHTSPRSIAVGAVVVNNDSVTLTISALGYSARTKAPNAAPQAGSTTVGPQAGLPRRRDVQIVVYRTTNAGSVYYQVGTPLASVVGSPTVSFIDSGLSDATLQTHPLLYGDGSDGTQPGNILDDECPPAWQGLTVHKNRIYGFDGPRVWLSKEFTTFSGSGVNEATAFSVDDGPGPLTALATLDSDLALFKADRLFHMSGEGPADNGADNDLTPPQRVMSDVGCIDWRSIAETPVGIYFRSPAGRRLLQRDLTAVPVTQVEDIDIIQPAITSAIVHPTAGRVIWTQNTNETTSPRVGGIVANDYILGSWQQATMSGLGFVSAAVANATYFTTRPPALGLNYYALTQAGAVWRENIVIPSTTPYLDPAGAFVGSVWRSPWLKSDGLQGWSQWGMIRLALQMLDPAALTITVSYDYSGSVPQTKTWTAAQLSAFLTPIIRLELLPIDQRASSMQITISDALDSSVTGQGFILQDLRVDYGVEPGGYRTPTTQQG